MDLSGLNSRQREAVTTTEGPVMVMAGAGSGKTKVLTTRISYLISELGIPSENILAVTFTNKAANEMKERISKMLNINTSKMWVSTFHSFAARLLRIEIDNLPPFNKYFNIIDDDDSLKIVKEVIKELGDISYQAKEMRKLISNSKNFLDFKVDNLAKKNDFQRVLEGYEKKLEEDNLLDFDDLIIKTIELFKNNPNILEKYQRKFQYILVDEFQDTNGLQYILVKMLSAFHKNIFVVGDDFQSIYSFRGAKIENINKFRKEFIDTKLILLEQNYRSTEEILNLANNVIEKNPNQIKKVMFSENSNGAKPKLYNAYTSYDETMFVCDKIKDLLLNGDLYSDIAIMYRANHISRGFEEQLIKYHIPYKIYGGISFFQRAEIKDMIAYLKLLVYSDDDFSFKRVVNNPKKAVGESIINKLTDVARNKDISLFEAINYYEGKGQGYQGLLTFKSQIEAISAQIENVKLPDLIDIILDETGYKDELQRVEDEDVYQDKYQNIKEFKSILKDAQESSDDSNAEKLLSLLSDLALKTNNDNNNDGNSVILTTYHQAKGLEFKNVFMVATEEGIFPSSNSFSEADIEEERRICYVGITRAKKRLFITHCDHRRLFGYDQEMWPSRFIDEMDKSLFEDNNPKRNIPISKPIPAKEAPKDLTKSDVNLKVGDKINHKIFGDGIIVSKDGLSITVAFKQEFGIKKLKADHPSIRKI